MPTFRILEKKGVLAKKNKQCQWRRIENARLWIL